jgi:hypothetical protein
MGENKNGWFPTFTGVQFFPAAPRVEDIHIEDIAHALALQCRFAGHVREFYSVAQHSVLVSLYVPASDALWGLLHDAAEAYVQDLIRPLKHHPTLAGYRDIEARMEGAIADRFGLPLPMPPSIKEADNRALMTERRDLYAYDPERYQWSIKAEPWPELIVPWGPRTAEARFLSRFAELTSAGGRP